MMKKCHSEVWCERMLTRYYPLSLPWHPPALPVRLSLPVQAVILAGGDLIHLVSISLHARARVCVYSVHGRCDGRWRVSGSGRAHVICPAEYWAVSGWGPGSDMCNIVTSELVCCPIWPVERGHMRNVLVRVCCFGSRMLREASNTLSSPQCHYSVRSEHKMLYLVWLTLSGHFKAHITLIKLFVS